MSGGRGGIGALRAVVGGVVLVAAGCQLVGTDGSARPRPAAAAGAADHVLAISVDGLNPDALTQLGHDELPNLWRLLDEGKSTLNARTSLEKTVTLPNHTGMVTGRRVAADRGGHGVAINDPTTATVHELAGHHVASIFEVAHEAGLDTAVYAGKDKFALFESSWPSEIETFLVEPDVAGLVAAARADLVADQTELIFLHLRSPDSAGHDHGFMGSEYLDAVRSVDAEIGRLLDAVDAHPEVADSLAIVLTADHGGLGGNHSNPTRLENFRIPFAAWGAGTSPGDLYERNSDFLDPGTTQPTYGPTRQPVRNANLANLSLDLLGLGPVPDSGIDPDQTLDVD
ncbi:alkaline phosphatase family protein [Nocardioides sp.]|uniref:alkaline phosphatase family protein n=1 Tax=Nocardioides sp. TaxID=35761 RepID=UPI002ED58237